MLPTKEQVAAIVAARKSPIPGFKVLLEGDSGTGKTFSLRSAVAAGLKVRIIFTEKSQSTVSDLPAPGMMWHAIEPPATSWNDLFELGNRVNTMSNESLQKGAINQQNQRQFLEVINTLNAFKDDRTGEVLPPADEWGTDSLLVIDGLSRLSQYARGLAVGYKPVLTQPDWGVMMQTVQHFITTVLDKLHCHFVLVSHLEMEKDEISGGLKKYPSTLGRKLGPLLPPMFDDVILSTRSGSKFLWQTFGDDTAITKGRILGMQKDINQDFGLILAAWKQKGGIVEP